MGWIPRSLLRGGFISEPEGAQILIDGNLRGRTPMSISLEKNEYEHVVIKKEGYESTTMNLTTSYDPVTLLNIFWDLSTTDLLTGNAFEYSPDMYSVQLKKIDSTKKK